MMRKDIEMVIVNVVGDPDGSGDSDGDGGSGGDNGTK